MAPIISANQLRKAAQNRRFGVDKKRSENSSLTEEQFTVIDEEIFVMAQYGLITAEVFGTDVVGPLGPGKEKYKYNELQDQTGAVIEMGYGGDWDNIDLIERSKDIPVIQDKFRLKRRKLEASQTAGEALDVTSARAAGSAIRDKEEEFLLIGGEKWDGLYNGAGLTTAATGDFGTAGKALDTVVAAINLMKTQKIKGPYNLIGFPTQITEISKNLLTGGKSEEEMILKVLQGGRIMECDQFTAGTLLVLTVPGRKYYEMLVGQDLTTEDFELPEKTGNGLRAFLMKATLIRDSNALCKITGA